MVNGQIRTTTPWTVSAGMWGPLHWEGLALAERGPAVHLLLRQLWEPRRLWSQWMLFRSFACRAPPTPRNTVAIPVASLPLKQNLVPISGTAPHTTICEMIYSTPTTGSTTTLV